MKNKIYLGCVADDFTGASDLASFLAAEGIKTVMYNGIPANEYKSEFEAVVIALKTRTAPALEAIHDTLAACDWLKGQGAKQLYIKYCSTFDSTKEGNIGPIIDAVMERYHIPFTLLCPSLPANNRVVRQGNLYVDGVLLHESHMKDHPLTPMWDSDLSNLIEAQSKYKSLKLDAHHLFQSKEEIEKRLTEFGKDKKHYYVIPDYYENIHSDRIIELFHHLPLLTGGSGLMTSLGKWITSHKKNISNDAGLILAGSCSVATLRQIEDYEKRGNCSYKLDPAKLLSGEQTFEKVWNFIEAHKEKDILIYSSDNASKVKEVQSKGKETVSKLLESTTAKLAVNGVKAGWKRIIVAGGETSGAVTKALGFEGYKIGKSIAPGVPIMTPVNHQDIRLVLKSGNFGQPDFFTRALEMIREDVQDE